jgi:hypothetical protein
MSNRLEHEFPAVRWRAAVPRGIDHDLVRSAMARGRHLQGAAIRRGVRAVAVTVGRALAEFVRCGAYGIAKRAPERDCRPAAKSGA